MLLKSFHFFLFPCLQHQSCRRVALPLLYLCDHLRMTGPSGSRPGIWDVDAACGPFFQAPPRLPEGAEAPELGSSLPSLLPVLPCRKVSLSWWFRIANQQSSVLWEKYNPYDRFHVGYFWTPESSAQDSVGQKAGEPGPVGQEPLGRGFSHIALTACLNLCSRCTAGSPSPHRVHVSVPFSWQGPDPCPRLAYAWREKKLQRLPQICFLVLCWGCHFKEKWCLCADERIRAQIGNSRSQASRSHQNPRHFRKHIFLRCIWEQVLWRRGIWVFVFLKRKNLAEMPLILHVPWKTLYSSQFPNCLGCKAGMRFYAKTFTFSLSPLCSSPFMFSIILILVQRS